MTQDFPGDVSSAGSLRQMTFCLGHWSLEFGYCLLFVFLELGIFDIQ